MYKCSRSNIKNLLQNYKRIDENKLQKKNLEFFYFVKYQGFGKLMVRLMLLLEKIISVEYNEGKKLTGIMKN